jgi:hypothetical protein
MHRFLLTLAITVGTLLLSNPAAAQLVPPTKKAAHVEIIKGPELESAADFLTIIRWVVNNPGGSNDHVGVVYYGTNPKDLNQTAKSPIRLNQFHPTSTFRVRITGLQPRTTYYYRVTSEESGGQNDGVKSAVGTFMTPAPGERIAGPPQHD